jgi:hypothetical protein
LFSHPKSYFFGELKPHAKYNNPFWEKINPERREKERERERVREITPLIVDT